MIHDGPLWLVGAGNMGGAMLRGWLDAGLDPAQLVVINRSGTPPAEGIVTVTTPPDGAVPATILLGVKPQMFDDVAPWIAPLAGPGTLLVSMLAGVEIASLAQRFPQAALCRIMPNTPVAIGRGVIGLHGPALAPAERARIDALMTPLGLAEWIDDEAAFDLVTALAGSGPAFLYRFIEALGRAGAALGLPADQAARLTLATVDGAARLAAESNEDPGRLADRVASPGGSTRKGLDVLDADPGLADLLRRTLAAAVARNREMAAAAR
ncbi:pyrroline-5-carboxylate reductase [Sphingomonas sp. 1P06PA]|uniref:pyrroline-5-carboxylate reductase n=1 Tax=Sphingomonas sp. 1P06PA TaxID=554121 RepID=UPI0039A4216C